MEGSLGLSDVKNSLFIHPCLSFVTPTGRAPLHCYVECVTTLSHSTSIAEFSTLPNFIQNTEKYLRNNSECLKLFYLMLLWSCCFWQETEKMSLESEDISQQRWLHTATRKSFHRFLGYDRTRQRENGRCECSCHQPCQAAGHLVHRRQNHMTASVRSDWWALPCRASWR